MNSGLSVKQRVLLETFRRFRKNEAVLHTLRYLFWECTQRCNLKCLHCGSDCLTDATVPEMPAEDFLKVTDSIARVHKAEDITVVLTGGEPLLRNDLASVGFRLRKQGFRWGLVTNGYMMTPGRMNELINSGLGAVTVSLDGMPDDHNWLRGNPDSYRRAVETIRMVARQSRLNSDVVTCVNRRNIHTLPEIQDQLNDTGIRNWRLFTISPIGRAAKEPDFQLTDDEFRYLMEFIARNRRKSEVPLAGFSCESYIGPFEGIAREGLFFCRAGIHIGSILADGSISACPNIDRNLVQGNMYSDNFNEVWEKRFGPFRNRSWNHVNDCSGCSHYRYCEGGGMHEWDYNARSLRRCNAGKLVVGD
ncbi:MAG: TIGR04133 family radical SAM/SPASM protein [Bacteroidota bacterium]